MTETRGYTGGIFVRHLIEKALRFFTKYDQVTKNSTQNKTGTPQYVVAVYLSSGYSQHIFPYSYLINMTHPSAGQKTVKHFDKNDWKSNNKYTVINKKLRLLNTLSIILLNHYDQPYGNLHGQKNQVIHRIKANGKAGQLPFWEVGLGGSELTTNQYVVVV